MTSVLVKNHPSFKPPRRRKKSCWYRNRLPLLCMAFGLFWCGLAVLMLCLYSRLVQSGIPYQKPTEPAVSPCYYHFCEFGATCRVNQTSKSAMCVCEQTCKDIFAPVCGTDNATYSNQCMLDRATCVRGTRIRVKSQGECRVEDPCKVRTMPCQFGAECMPSIDGKTSRCQCPGSCPSYGDNVGNKPVCGNDGNDYKNECEMRKASCETLTDIKVKYYGKCDPCEDYKCDQPTLCQVSDKKRHPECRCNYHCWHDVNLVCGTDGHTYSNQCVLKRQACKSRKDIRVHKQGKCTPGLLNVLKGTVQDEYLTIQDNNPCSDKVCGPGEECMVDNTGNAKCACPPPCQLVLRRVCGNDSKTYDNECELRRRSCMDKRYVTVQHQGPCNTNSPCEFHRCMYGATCRERGGEAVCECPQCSEEYSPVCGDNGITYENECKLKQENCVREENIKVVKRGTCDECGQDRCQFYAVCQRLNGNTTCVCPTSCVKNMNAPVCGSDDMTYDNECELRVQSCQRKVYLTIVSHGSCDTCRGIMCHFGAKCENGQCVCPMVCPSVRQPVCASDDRTYGNECEMRRAACRRSVDLRVVREGECSVGDYFSGSGSGDFGSGDVFGGFTFSDDEEVDIEEIEVIDKNHLQLNDPCSEEKCIRYGGTCEMDNVQLKCSCKFSCPTKREPVCGSDGIVYGNKCTMLHQSCVRKQVIKEQPMDTCDEFNEDEPCPGSTPLINPDTLNDFDCGQGMETCPPRSFCHLTTSFAKCCKNDNAPITNCTGTKYGCCQDNVTPASGPRKGGCPDECQCHPMGSFSSTCDPRTKQCPCKPGVGGQKCDRCEVGYWGLHRIERDGFSGCIPCSCNEYGSFRDDCEQMTGRCMCRHHVTGMRCDTCQNGNRPGPGGCTESTMPLSCADITCPYGGICREDPNPYCDCKYNCDNSSHGSDVVCGTDNQNYGSRCQLEQFACRLQKEIKVAHVGHCKADWTTGQTTHSPAKSRKTTRHIIGREEPEASDSVNKETVAPAKTISSDDTKACKDSYIQDLCDTDDDCCPSNSYCKGICYCKEGYVPSVDNTDCFILTSQKQLNATDPCDPSPCLAGSRCIRDEFKGYRCACPLGMAGSLCNKEVKIKTPSFSGRSHLELPRIYEASQDLAIDVVFSSVNKDAIILYNSKHINGSGDFVSLTMKDGYIEFRYDLGAGHALIRSRQPVDLIQSHRVLARRSKEMGELIVNREETVKGRSPGTLSSLDLTDPLMLGYIPYASKETYERVGVTSGLVGCIFSLRAGSRTNLHAYALHSQSEEIIRGIDINECGKNPCQSMPCQNGGTCLVIDTQLDYYECDCQDGYKGMTCDELVDPCAMDPCNGGTCIATAGVYVCQCQHGREGMHCERESIPQVFVPQFTGDSYMEMPLEENLYNTMSITVWFKALKPNGVIFFATQKARGEGDFIALNMRKKKLHFVFSLGSGIGDIESLKHVRLDKWHTVTVSLKGKEGQMSIDGHAPITDVAKGPSTFMNIDNRPLVLGGFRDRNDLPSQANIENGLTGAIQRVIINGRTIDGLMAAALSMRNISTYNGAPCGDTNPCMNDGVCVPRLNQFECRCTKDYMGKFCTKLYSHTDIDQPIAFEGMTSLSYPNEISREQQGQQSNQFKVRFRTSEPDGILLLQVGGDTVTSDYLSLAVKEGYPEFSYNLGKQSLGNLHIIRSTVKVDDGAWHEVVITRSQREGTIQVDDEEPVIASSDDGTQQLDTDGLLWVGGRHDLPWGLPTMKNFNGCIDKVEVKRMELHLVEERNGDSTSFSFCQL